MSDDFYLHEDEWGMIELLPRENSAERREMVIEAQAHGEAHRAPGGIGWTEIFVAPTAAVQLGVRNINLAAMAELLGPDWQRYARVTSGYSSYVEDCPSSYAFRGPRGDGYKNVVYGTFKDDVVTSICVTRCGPTLAPVLFKLGTTFQLILCDLWSDVVIDLADQVAIARYVAVDDSDDE